MFGLSRRLFHSKSGYQLRLLNLVSTAYDTLLYMEDWEDGPSPRRRLTLPILHRRGVFRYHLTLSSDPLIWRPPFHEERISAVEWETIRKRIVEGLGQMSIRADVVKPSPVSDWAHPHQNLIKDPDHKRFFEYRCEEYRVTYRAWEYVAAYEEFGEGRRTCRVGAEYAFPLTLPPRVMLWTHRLYWEAGKNRIEMDNEDKSMVQSRIEQFFINRPTKIEHVGALRSFDCFTGLVGYP